jgi:ABC-2 type transport system ATP-binding protein
MPDRDAAAVVIRSLVKRFGAFTAVDHVNLEVRRGEIFGFLGPNGAGKSTTIRILCGLLEPTSGTASVAGYDVGRQTLEVKQNIGYMSQRFSLYDDLTVEENIEFFSGIYGLTPERRAARKDFVLEMAGLRDRRDSKTGLLAGGWKQRLALGCAILHEPPILFLDEPTSGVDPIARRGFWELIYQLSAAGSTIFVSTHYMDEAEYCHRVALMYRGRVIALGSPAQLKHSLNTHHILELESDSLFDSMKLLEGREEILETAVFGGGLHVSVRDPMTAIEAVRQWHRQAGIRLRHLARIDASMEDVFVALIEREEETAA